MEIVAFPRHQNEGSEKGVESVMYAGGWGSGGAEGRTSIITQSIKHSFFAQENEVSIFNAVGEWMCF